MNVQAIKIGTTVNVSINGKLHKKNCGNAEHANKLFASAIKTNNNPTDKNIAELMGYLNDKIRIAYLNGLELNLETNEVYMAGFSTPIPETLLEVIKDYTENNYPIDAIMNFWKLLMINPDKIIRERLFDFIKTHDFVLTDKGYILVYKAVYYKEDQNRNAVLEEFVSNQFLHVKKDWKCSPNKYVVYRVLENNTYAITKVDTILDWDEKERGIEILGRLGELFDVLFNQDVPEATTIYSDMYSRTMKIKLGVPVAIERKECDADHSNECSYGLHVGATKYVNSFGSNADAILVCLVNPANVVAVPNYDHSKIRVSEYFPLAVATYENGKIDIVEQSYFELDYCAYEKEELEKQILMVKANELPIETAMNTTEETRSMSELMKILDSRMVDITKPLGQSSI